MRKWFDRLPSWLWAFVVFLVFKALSAWVLAPLLDIIPAYALFGGIFLIGIILLYRGTTGERSILLLIIIALLSASVTLLLYAAALDARRVSTYWWYLAGAICFVTLFLILWLSERNTNRGQDRTGQPLD